MSKPRLDPDKVANELTGASAFFKPVTAPTPEATSAPAGQPPVHPTAESRTPVRPGRVAKRQMIRHPFELYMDQLERLRELADQQRRSGGVGSMSRMVRDAIDRFLDEHSPTAE